MPTTDRKLRVFPSTGSGRRLCHSSQDKPIVRELYQRLHVKGWINPQRASASHRTGGRILFRKVRRTLMPTTDRKLRVFPSAGSGHRLYHASQDKPIVRELYQRLLAEGWIDPWLDEENLLPGQDWEMEIEKAIESG